MIDSSMTKEKWLQVEDDLEKSLQAYLGNEAQIVRALYKSRIADWTDIIFEGPIRHCKSPAEKVMFLSLHHVWFIKLYGGYSSLDLSVYPQYELEIDDRKFKVDLLVTLRQCQYLGYKDNRPSWNILDEAQVVVECDGYDYHERTNEQDQQDKERDRLLLRRGYPVLHFTDSEIYKDPDGCAREVLEFLFDKMDAGYDV